MPEHAASDGWLDRFRKRHNVLFRELSGESSGVDGSVCNDWIEKLPQLLTGYELADIFNCDETGLIFKQTPSKSLIQAGEECSGGKKSKERLSVLLCASATGEKLRPLVIGRAAKPQAFWQAHLTTNQLPVTWRSNKKAWMTGFLFTEWLHSVDKLMRYQKRRILLLLDNCSAHVSVDDLQNVKLLFLPPNTTSKIQPLDQGIINSFKLNYRKLLLEHLIDHANEVQSLSEFTKSISVLNAILWIDRAWNLVQRGTIHKC